MKAFLASSQESLEDLREISSWIEEEGHEPVPWDSPSLFLPGENTFEKLIQISKQVDAAVFIFGADDKVWYRADALLQPRDNVLIEFGVFASSLGQRRAIICIKGSPKIATDLRGIVIVDKDKPHHARMKIQMWLRNLVSSREEDPTITLMRRELEEVKEQLEFEHQKTKEFQSLLTEKHILNFDKYDLTTDGHWKLLYDYDYFWSVVSSLREMFSTPQEWQEELKRCNLSFVAEQLSWEHHYEKSRTRAKVSIAKSLRVIRTSRNWQAYIGFINMTNPTLREALISLGRMRIETMSKETYSED